MIKITTIMILMLLLTGCEPPIHDKITVSFKCIDGKLVSNLYSANLVTKSEDIKTESNIKIKHQLVEEKGIKIWCENTEEVNGK